MAVCERCFAILVSNAVCRGPFDKNIVGELNRKISLYRQKFETALGSVDFSVNTSEDGFGTKNITGGSVSLIRR